MSSVFTRIITGEIPCYKIYEDENNLAFLDINPETAGHTLVIPKIEVDRIYDLPEEDYISLMLTVKKVVRKMEDVLGKRVIWKVVGTDVSHAHIHLMPFDKNWQQGRIIKVSENEMNIMRERLRF